MADVGDVFKPGEKCDASGIYTVIHDSQHRQTHEVTCVYGKPFPPCSKCGGHVRFKLKYKAIHLANHESFK